MGTGRSARVLRLLEQSATEQLRRRARGGRSSEQDRWTSWCSRWPSGYSGTRENGQVARQRESMDQVELRDESVRCGCRPAAVRCRDQYGCGEQRAAWRCAGVCRLDHVAHGKRLESHRKCFTRLEYGSVAISLSDVFPEERRKVGGADDGGTASLIGHERCGGRSLRRNGRRRDLEDAVQRCFREYWKKQGLRVRVLVLREATVSHRKQRNHDMGQSKGSKKSKKQRKEQERVQVLSRVRQVWSGCEIQRSKRVRSKQEKLGRDETRQHGERRSECVGDWSSVAAREKSQDSG